MKVRQKKLSIKNVRYGITYRRNPSDSNEAKKQKRMYYEVFHIINNWFKTHQDAFAIPLSFAWRQKKGRSSRKLVLKFQNLTPCLGFYLRDFGCGVDVYAPVNHDLWDGIFDRDIDPVQLEDGRWVCYEHYRWHNQNPDTVPLEAFSSLQELTEKFMLEPFLKWMNEEVAVSKWLCLYETEGGGITWATIEKGEIDETERCRMQLRHEQLEAGLIRVGDDPNTPKVIPTKVKSCQPVHQLPLFITRKK